MTENFQRDGDNGHDNSKSKMYWTPYIPESALNASHTSPH